MTETARLDGFIVTGGNASGTSFNDFFGGGMHNNNSSAPVLVSVTFYDNAAGNAGGGLGNSWSNPRFIDATNGDLRLLPGSTAIDAGDHHPHLHRYHRVPAPRPRGGAGRW